VVWSLLGLVCIAVFVTYARLDDLYRVSEEGVVGGAGRLLVLLNFPIALAAMGVVAVLLERGASRTAGVVAIGLCALTPFTVDQDDLDARLVNVGPALGVAVAVALTTAARPDGRLAPRRPLDPARLAVGLALVVIAIPWLFADLGFYAPDPVLADEPSPDEPIAAVHLGHHHGMDGVLLALCALLLTRAARSRATQALLALMFVYGAGNAIQDGWLEQVEKRGWTDVGLPSLLYPELSLAWLTLLVAAGAVYALIRTREA
jgi:hypothetical protein